MFFGLPLSIGNSPSLGRLYFNIYYVGMTVKVELMKIVLYPAAVLRKKSRPVEQITQEVREVTSRMIQLMHEADGVGLAAPQVGLSWRLFVANPTGQPQDDRVFINPVLRDPSPDAWAYAEGCLSLPHIRAEIRRPKKITIEATDLDGQKFTLTSDDLASRIWQHENDHLDGILILDRMSPLDKKALRHKIQQLEAAGAGQPT